MKFALVTGSSRGIGRSIALALADQGYHILVNYKSNDKEAEETKRLIEEKQVSAVLLKFDVSNIQSVETVLGGWMTENSTSTIEVLINNAGIREDALMIWMTEEQWDGVLGSSLDGFFYVTRTVLKGMLSNRYGRIVNVVSLSGIKGMPGQINYSAAKAGVIGATKALAQEVARRNVTVNAVAPGFIRTDMTQDLDEQALKNLIPMQRFGEPEEVAYAVSFFTNKQASYITGTVLSVNGGLYS